MSSFHDAQTPDDLPEMHGAIEPPAPVVYRIVREIGDRHGGPMEYHVEACAAAFLLCASCAPTAKGEDPPERLDDKAARYAHENGETCADCGDEL